MPAPWDTYSPTRRTFLSLLGSSAVAVTTSSTASAQSTPTELTVGVESIPKNLNLFSGGSPSKRAILQAIYEPGIVFDEDYEPKPWLFDWSISYAGSFPTVSLQPQSGIVWNDGTPFTAGDIAFSYQYLKEYYTGVYGGLDRQLVFETTESDGAVTLELTSSVGAWLETVLRTTMLPAHIWEGNERPASEQIDTPVGTGAYTVERFTPESEVVLQRRPDRQFGEWGSETPVQRIRFVEHPMTPGAVVDGLSNRTIHTIAHDALDWKSEPSQQTGIESTRTPSGTVGQLMFNLDRKPLDDRLLRECLVKTFDAQTYVDQLGPDSTLGHLAIPEDFSPYRSNEATPTDKTRYRAYTHEVDDVVKKVRNVLDTPHPAYVYSFRAPLATEIDSRYGHMLHVDDRPFNEAHKGTDNGSKAGPLKIVLPNEYADDATRTAFENWADLLVEIGIPTELQIIPLGEAFTKVFDERDFDVANIRITHDAELSLFADLYSSNNSDESVSLNPMGYANADAAITEASQTLDRNERRHNIEDALMQIYEDIPVYPYHHESRFNPVSTQFENWTPTRRGVATHRNWVGVSPNPDAQVQNESESTTNADTEATVTETATEPSEATQDTEAVTPGFTLPKGSSRLAVVGTVALSATLVGKWLLGGASDAADGSVVSADTSQSAHGSQSTTPAGDTDVTTTNESSDEATTDTTTATADSDATEDGDAPDESANAEATGDEELGDSAATADTGATGATAVPEIFSHISDLTGGSYLRTRGELEEYSCAPDSDPTRSGRLLTTTDDADDALTDRLSGVIRHWRALSSHRCVPSVITDGTEPRPWLAIEQPTGTSLAEIDTLTPADAADLIEDVADAVRQAGLYNARHHTLTPDCIFHEEGGDPSVIDWGLRPLLGDQVTPYTAPEQIDTEAFGEVGRPTDIWALGGLTYRVLTGEAPFKGATDDELEAAILEGETPLPSDVGPTLEAFDDVIRRALVRDPEKRYSSPHHFALDLKGAV